MIYYAHPGEILIDHLLLTGDLAGVYGRDIDSEKVTRQMGLMHDVGKHTKKFQDVLKGKAGKIDHAIVAAEAYEAMHEKDSAICECDMIRIMMEHIMAGHHSDFNGEYDPDIYEIAPDYILPEDLTAWNPTKDEGKENALGNDKEFREILDYIMANNLIYNIRNSDHKDPEEMTEAARMLYARMLMSCLVDADYTATASLFNPDILATIKKESEIVNPKKMSEALDTYCNGFGGKELPINVLRAGVYKDAGKAGTDYDFGLYKMTAPTGLGKTTALMRFALSQVIKNGQKRIFVILPYISITKQNADVYRAIFGNDVVIEDDSAVEHEKAEKMLAERWQAPVIVTTSVKFFQTLFSSKAPALRRLHSIAKSVVVFDESQTLPDGLTSVTMRTLQALTEHFGTTVLLSTATQPEYSKRKDLEIKVKEIISDPGKLYEEYDELKNTKVTADFSRTYTPAEIVEKYKDEKQVLYVVNTIQDAKDLFLEAQKRHEVDTMFMSSSCTPFHKDNTITEVRQRLKNGEKCHLISTQCIEVGVDVDFPAGCRVYSPYTSITQTSGRINRNCEGAGELFVFWLDGKHCPDDSYKSEAYISEYMAHKGNGILDLNDLKKIEDYYILLYAGTNGKDNNKIEEAELDENIYAMGGQYKIIKEQLQYTVMCPYHKDGGLFKQAANKYQANGYHIAKKDMRSFRNACVQVFAEKKKAEFIEAHCHRLKVQADGMDYPTNWFIADMDNIYDDTTGLKSAEEEGGLFL